MLSFVLRSSQDSACHKADMNEQQKLMIPTNDTGAPWTKILSHPNLYVSSLNVCASHPHPQ